MQSVVGETEFRGHGVTNREIGNEKLSLADSSLTGLVMRVW